MHKATESIEALGPDFQSYLGPHNTDRHQVGISKGLKQVSQLPLTEVQDTPLGAFINSPVIAYLHLSVSCTCYVFVHDKTNTENYPQVSCIPGPITLPLEKSVIQKAKTSLGCLPKPMVPRASTSCMVCLWGGRCDPTAVL